MLPPPTNVPPPARVPARSPSVRYLALGLVAGGALFAARAAGPVAADVVTTTEGLVLEGRVETKADGSVGVTTPTGTVTVPKARIRGIEAGDGAQTTLRAALAGLPKDDVDGRFRLALRAEAAGATGVAREAYEAILALDPDHAAARRALGFEREGAEWLPQTEARRRRGLVLFDGAWMLPVEAESAARAKAPAALAAADKTLAEVLRLAAGPDAVLAAAARERWSVAPVASRVATATALLRDRAVPVRALACAELSAAGDEASLRPLLASALADPDAKVRDAAVVAAASFGNDDTAVPFVRALASPHPGVVAAAAHGLATLGDPRAIVYLVKRISGHGDSPRAVVEFLTKTSYVRDYDVEIAQAANIANPQVGIVMDGIVLDLKVLDLAMERTVVETVLVDAFNSLAGTSVPNAAGVLAWAAEHPEAMRGFPPAAPAKRHAGKATTVSATR